MNERDLAALLEMANSVPALKAEIVRLREALFAIKVAAEKCIRQHEDPAGVVDWINDYADAALASTEDT